MLQWFAEIKTDELSESGYLTFELLDKILKMPLKNFG